MEIRSEGYYLCGAPSSISGKDNNNKEQQWNRPELSCLIIDSRKRIEWHKTHLWTEGSRRREASGHRRPASVLECYAIQLDCKAVVVVVMEEDKCWTEECSKELGE